jgi:hypothetical protein
MRDAVIVEAIRTPIGNGKPTRGARRRDLDNASAFWRSPDSGLPTSPRIGWKA